MDWQQPKQVVKETTRVVKLISGRSGRIPQKKMLVGTLLTKRGMSKVWRTLESSMGSVQRLPSRQKGKAKTIQGIVDAILLNETHLNTLAIFKKVSGNRHATFETEISSVWILDSPMTPGKFRRQFSDAVSTKRKVKIDMPSVTVLDGSSVRMTIRNLAQALHLRIVEYDKYV